jgi:hypothetical protein
VEVQFPIEPTVHVAECSLVNYTTNPPSSGNHYPIWAAFKTYTSPVPRGYYVHDLEHGAVVITYNCPDGCSAEVAALQGIIDAFPNDPLCDSNPTTRKRVVMTPDPKLDVRFGASAWGFTLRSDCVDTTAFASFLAAHYAHGPENFCSEGVDVIANGLQPKCGEPDYMPPGM